VRRKRGAEKVGVTRGRGLIIFGECLEGIRTCKVEGGMISGIKGSVRHSRIIRTPCFGILMNHARVIYRHIAIRACRGGREGEIFPRSEEAFSIRHRMSRLGRQIGRWFGMLGDVGWR
jgi:hypothetical protein